MKKETKNKIGEVMLALLIMAALVFLIIAAFLEGFWIGMGILLLFVWSSSMFYFIMS